MTKLTDNYHFNSFELINYTVANKSDILAILEMRNHPDIRKVMVNTDEISQNSHLEYIKKLKDSTDKGYWIVTKNNTIIGALNIDITDPNCFSGGMFVNPMYMNQGYGLLINFMLLEHIFNNFQANNFSSLLAKSNKVIIRLHKFFKGNITDVNSIYNKVHYSKEEWAENRSGIQSRINF